MNGENVDIEKFLIKMYPRNNMDIVGRDEEIKEMVYIMSGIKNNPLLVGNSGVGKTAIVEGLAKKLEYDENIPYYLKGKSIYRLSIIDLISNAKYQGMLESRIQSIFSYIKKTGNIMFIDEIHLIVSASNKTQGGIDISSLLKTEIDKTEFCCIGATTFEDFGTMNLDKALLRRFRRINIDELSEEGTEKILRYNSKKLEDFYCLKIREEVFSSSVSLSREYLDGYLPEKAISLLDETCGRIRSELWYEPKEIIYGKKRLKSLEEEKEYISVSDKKYENYNDERIEREKTFFSEEEKKIIISHEINKESDRLNNLIRMDSEEKENVSKLIDITKNLSKLNKKLEYFKKNFDFYQVDRIKDLEIIPLENEKFYLEEKVEKNVFRKYFVDKNDVAFTVAKRQNLTVDKLLSDKKKRMFFLPIVLERKIKGQKEALKVVTDAIFRSNVGIKDPNKPFASFLFVGPTGVGKTEIALTIANQLFGKKNFLRIDMTEFSESHSISRLLGSPPGYVGFRERSRFEFIREKRNSLVLFDEIEKCHNDIFNSFLQILDNGIVTLSNGEEVNFRNTMIIMTTNLGYEIYEENINKKGGNEFKNEIMDELKGYFRPEFLNRFDEIVFFNSLKKEDVFEIIENELLILFERIKNEKGINISKKDEKIVEKIFSLSYSPSYGARSIKRFIEKEIGTLIAKGIISNFLQPGSSYTLDLDSDNRFKIFDLYLLS